MFHGKSLPKLQVRRIFFVLCSKNSFLALFSSNRLAVFFTELFEEFALGIFVIMSLLFYFICYCIFSRNFPQSVYSANLRIIALFIIFSFLLKPLTEHTILKKSKIG
jgi:multisubunit Na+/H+ antiporter MnhG subunit